jgi:hypothetical protein
MQSSASKVAPQATKPNPCSSLGHQTPTPTSVATQAPTRHQALPKTTDSLPSQVTIQPSTSNGLGLAPEREGFKKTAKQRSCRAYTDKFQ